MATNESAATKVQQPGDKQTVDAHSRVLALLDEAVSIAPSHRLKRALLDARRAVPVSVREGARKDAGYQATRKSISGRSESIPPSSDATVSETE